MLGPHIPNNSQRQPMRHMRSALLEHCPHMRAPFLMTGPGPYQALEIWLALISQQLHLRYWSRISCVSDYLAQAMYCMDLSESTTDLFCHAHDNTKNTTSTHGLLNQ